MYTIRESDLFKKQVQTILTEDERLNLFAFLAENPFSGDVIRNSGGFRKLRWQSGGKGKSGGSRIIYYNQLEDGLIDLVMIYEKKNLENISGEKLAKIKGE